MANGTIYIFQWINFVTVCFIHFQYHEEDLFSLCLGIGNQYRVDVERLCQQSLFECGISKSRDTWHSR